jgi:hypothetical protein
VDDHQCGKIKKLKKEKKNCTEELYIQGFSPQFFEIKNLAKISTKLEK